MDDIDINEVETVSVLKDASATAVYGVKGGNGVILITTKKGNEGRKLGVDVISSVTFDTPAYFPKFQNEYGGGWGGSSTTSYSENDYLKGTLVMDAFDEESGEQIWQGVAKATVQEKPEKREKSIPKTIAALMKKFPVAVPK